MEASGVEDEEVQEGENPPSSGGEGGVGWLYQGVQALELRRLRYFVAVAEELHFGRAADRLGVGQPALSRQVAHLEAGLGCMLFDRTRSQIHLTAAGRELLPRALEILRQVHEAAFATRRAAQGGQGVLGVGFVGSASYSVLPEILKAYRAKSPMIDLMLYPMNTSELHEALITRKVQAGFSRPFITDPEIVNLELVREPLIVALPDDDPLARQTRVALADLKSSAFVIYPHNPRPSFADHIISLCQEAGFTPRIAQETMDLQTALGLIAVGVGVSLVPGSVQNSHRHGITYRPLAGTPPMTGLSLSYRRDNRTEVLSGFREVVQAVIRSQRT